MLGGGFLITPCYLASERILDEGRNRGYCFLSCSRLLSPKKKPRWTKRPVGSRKGWDTGLTSVLVFSLTLISNGYFGPEQIDLDMSAKSITIAFDRR